MTSFRHLKFLLALSNLGQREKAAWESLGSLYRQPLVTALKPIPGPVPSVLSDTHEFKALSVSVMQIYTFSLCWAFHRVPDFPGICTFRSVWPFNFSQ